MKAAWYEKQGPARDVLTIGEMDDPQPLAGEVRIRVAFSGVNPGDVKKRQDAFGVGMPYPRVIPHSDGAGTVNAVGEGVSREWIGRRVWCYRAQSYPSFRHGCRVHGGSFEAGGSTARRCATGAGCLTRHSRHNGSSGCSCGGFGRRANRSGARRCGGGRNLCRSTSTSSGSASHRPLPCRKRQGNRIAGGSRRGSDDR